MFYQDADGSGLQAEEFRLLGNGKEKLVSKLYFVSYHHSLRHNYS